MNYRNIYDLITAEETAFRLPITVREGYEWSMYDHISTTILYKNSVYKTGKSQEKPFKNIIRPILNLQYRAEGFDVKDIELFVNDAKLYYKSFLLRKYHDQWARENGIDTFIDNLVESYVDFGGVLVKKTKSVKPEVVPWERIAFCDQTDVLGGPIAEKHSFSPEELKQMENSGWENVDDVILLSTKKGGETDTPKVGKAIGKYIEVYEVHLVAPKFWLYDYGLDGNPSGYWFDPEDDKMELTRQVHICTFYTDEKGNRQGIWLYKSKEDESPYKVLLRDKIYGRALGLGGAEELFESQIWANYDVIRMKELLDAASKIVLQSDDPKIRARHPSGLSNIQNLEILEVDKGSSIGQVDTFPRNLALFEKSVVEWENHARTLGAANESIMGESPSAGTPFKLQELVAAEAHSLHEYRKGKIAVFVDEIYREWIIPHLSSEITNGVQFLSTLSMDEMTDIGAQIVKNAVNRKIIETILNGELVNEEEVQAFAQIVDEQFKESDKKFLTILKGEMKSAPVDVKINIVGKQKNLARNVDKLVNVVRFLFSTYNAQTGQFAALQDPTVVKLLQEIFEWSGLTINLGKLPAQTSPGTQQPSAAPLQDLAEPQSSPIPA